MNIIKNRLACTLPRGNPPSQPNRLSGRLGNAGIVTEWLTWHLALRSSLYPDKYRHLRNVCSSHAYILCASTYLEQYPVILLDAGLYRAWSSTQVPILVSIVQGIQDFMWLRIFHLMWHSRSSQTKINPAPSRLECLACSASLAHCAIPLAIFLRSGKSRRWPLLTSFLPSYRMVEVRCSRHACVLYWCLRVYFGGRTNRRK